MASRPYNSVVRKDAEAETLRRIVAATVALHAEKGAMATSHAEIAARAGVSVPTVYKFFPTRHALLPACMGHVEKDAPPLDAEAILAVPDRDARLGILVETVHARYRYYHPWFRWIAVDAPSLPMLADAASDGQRQLAQLIQAALDDAQKAHKAHKAGIPAEVSALVQVLLDYCTWQRLEQILGDSAKVSRATVQAIRLVISSSFESE